MEDRYCEKCKKHLPIEMFENGRDKASERIYYSRACRSCYKKAYYNANRKRILKRQKENREKKSAEKKLAGEYKWTASLEDEEEKFRAFITKHDLTF